LTPRFALVVALALLASAGPAAAQYRPAEKSEWEIEQEKRDWKEGEVKLPAFFKGDDLIEFQVARTTSLRFYIDPASLSVGADGVVRYTLVARSPSGAENVSYEGLHCKTSSHRIYALGQGNGTWKQVTADWKPASTLWARVLRREFFCPSQLSIFSTAEGLDALRRGGHPDMERLRTGR